MAGRQNGEYEEATGRPRTCSLQNHVISIKVVTHTSEVPYHRQTTTSTEWGRRLASTPREKRYEGIPAKRYAGLPIFNQYKSRRNIVTRRTVSARCPRPVETRSSSFRGVAGSFDTGVQILVNAVGRFYSVTQVSENDSARWSGPRTYQPGNRDLEGHGEGKLAALGRATMRESVLCASEKPNDDRIS